MLLTYCALVFARSVSAAPSYQLPAKLHLAETAHKFILQPEGKPWFALYETMQARALDVIKVDLTGATKCFTDLKHSRNLEDILVWAKTAEDKPTVKLNKNNPTNKKALYADDITCDWLSMAPSKANSGCSERLGDNDSIKTKLDIPLNEKFAVWYVAIQPPARQYRVTCSIQFTIPHVLGCDSKRLSSIVAY